MDAFFVALRVQRLNAGSAKGIIRALIITSDISRMPESAIPDELRYKLLKKIANNPEISQRELAGLMGVSLGKTNYCLKALVEAGWVKVVNFARSHSKLNYVYVLTPKGVAEKTAVTLRFLKHKQVQYEKLEQEIKQLKHEAKKLTAEHKEMCDGSSSRSEVN